MRLAAFVVFLSVLACGGSSGGRKPGEPFRPFSEKVPRVGEWTPLRYAAYRPPKPSLLPSTSDRVGEVQAYLSGKYNEPFVVTSVTRPGRSLPGWPAGAGGDFRAHPVRDPAIRFGGSVAGDDVDNFQCAQNVRPLELWVERELKGEGVLTHDCLERYAARNVPAVRVWDGSGDGLATVAEFWERRVGEGMSETSLTEVKLIVTVMPEGAGEVARRVAMTSRRAKFARDEVARRSRATITSTWTGTGWTRAVEEQERMSQVEALVDAAMRPVTPKGFGFEAVRLGRPDGVIADIVRPTMRGSISIYAFTSGELDTAEFVRWVVEAQNAVDPGLLLYWNLTVCDEGVADPWADPDRCTRGFDDFTIHTLEKPRKKTEFWPFPPGPGSVR